MLFSPLLRWKLASAFPWRCQRSVGVSKRYLVYNSPIGYYLTTSMEAKAPHHQIVPLNVGDVKIIPVPMLSDNYSYLIIDKRTDLAAVVDPADPNALIPVLEKEGCRLEAVLTTHKHWDHSGGNERLKSLYPYLRIVGSATDGIPALTEPVREGDIVTVGDLRFKVLETPGHTLGHVIYHLPDAQGSLFTGDIVFISGIGRFFEGTAADVLPTIDRVSAFNPKTLIWPGHEYTFSNLLFAVHIEPENEVMKNKLEHAKDLREKKIPTVPSTVEEELAANPFFRVDQATILKSLDIDGIEGSSTERRTKALAALRAAKDAFKPKP